MKQYQHRFVVNAPLADVAAFHKDTRALRELVPPPMTVKFNRVEPIAEGSISDFRLGIGPIAVRWVAVHSDVTEQNGFVDTQQQGPFRSWRHRHKFRALDEKRSEVIDEIEADFGNPLSRFMWLNLPILFAFRARRTKAALEKNGKGKADSDDRLDWRGSPGNSDY